MNVNPIVISALTPILGIEPTPKKYTGSASEYITFQYADERPALSADDADILDETTIQVHGFTKINPHALKKAIRKALKSADFSIQSTAEMYEGDTSFFHIVVYASIDGVIDDG